MGLSVALSAAATGLFAGKMDMHGRQITGVNVYSVHIKSAPGNKYKVKDQADPTTSRVTLTKKPWVTDKAIINSQTKRANNLDAYKKPKAKTPVVKKQQIKQPAKQQTISESKRQELWSKARNTTNLSQVPKSAKLKIDKERNEASWLVGDGHIAYAEFDPKTKKILYGVSIEG